MLKIDGDIVMYGLAAEYNAVTRFYPFGKREKSLGYIVAAEVNKKSWQQIRAMCENDITSHKRQISITYQQITTG